MVLKSLVGDEVPGGCVCWYCKGGRSASGVVAGTKEGYMLVLKRGMVLPGLEQQVFYCHHMCGFKGNFEQVLAV